MTKIKVILKEYLAGLKEEEKHKPFGERKNIPNLMDISKESGISYSIVSRFANNQMRRFHLASITSILDALHSLGCEVEISDVLEYQKEKKELTQ